MIIKHPNPPHPPNRKASSKGDPKDENEKDKGPSKPSPGLTLKNWLKNSREGDNTTPPPQNEGTEQQKNNCTIKRGVCILHNLKAERSTVTEKKWGKVSTGYGWIYRKKIRFFCRAEKSSPTGPLISTSDVSTVGSDVNKRISATHGQEINMTGGLARENKEGLD